MSSLKIRVTRQDVRNAWKAQGKGDWCCNCVLSQAVRRITKANYVETGITFLAYKKDGVRNRFSQAGIAAKVRSFVDCNIQCGTKLKSADNVYNTLKQNNWLEFEVLEDNKPNVF